MNDDRLDDRLKELWASSNTEGNGMSARQIADLVAPGIGRSARSVRWFVLVYGALLVAALALAAANLYGYRANPALLAVHAGAALAALLLVAFGSWLARALDTFDRATDDVAATLRRRLAFLRGPFEAWLWSAGVAVALVTFEFNALIDNEAGTYRVDRPAAFAAVLLVQVIFVYAAGKVRQRPAIAELRAALHDLEAGSLEKTPRVDALRRRWRAWHGVLVGLLLLGIAAGLVAWVLAGG